MKYHLLGLLASPIDPATQRKELNGLIEECFKLATVQVRYQMSKLHKPGIMGDLTAKDIAVDAIAPLFTPAPDGFIRQLSESFHGWNPPVKSEEDAHFMLISILSHRVKQHIQIMMRESDPFFAKILDSLNYHIKKEGLVKSEKFKVCYVSETDPAVTEVEPCSYEDLLKLQSSLYSIKHLTVRCIIDHISRGNEKPAAIPLLALAKRIKEVNLSFENPVITCQATETEYDIESISSAARAKVLERLQTSYLRKGKLSSSETQLLENALENILTDLKDGGIKPGLYHYIESIDPAVTVKVYQEKYHHIFEYLIKILKKELAHLLSVRHEFSE